MHPLLHIFPPRRQWNSDANSIGRTNYPFIVDIGNARHRISLNYYSSRVKKREKFHKGGNEFRRNNLTRISRFTFKIHNEFARIFTTFLFAFLSKWFRKENSRSSLNIIDWLTFEIPNEESKILIFFFGTRGFNKLVVSFRIERGLKEGVTCEIREKEI